MGMLSDYVQNKVTDLLYRGQAFTAPVTLYFALLKCTHGARANTTAYALNNTIAVPCAGDQRGVECSPHRHHHE